MEEENHFDQAIARRPRRLAVVSHGDFPFFERPSEDIAQVIDVTTIEQKHEEDELQAPISHYDDDDDEDIALENVNVQCMDDQLVSLMNSAIRMKKMQPVQKEKRAREETIPEEPVAAVSEPPLSVYALGFCQPVLMGLGPRQLRQFKVELEVAEEARSELNKIREPHRQIPPPEPHTFIYRFLWGKLFFEFRKVRPSISHMSDATLDDLQTWLVKALVPEPDNHKFLLNVEAALKKAWSESYYFGHVKLSSSNSSVASSQDDADVEEYDEETIEEVYDDEDDHQIRDEKPIEADQGIMLEAIE